MLSGCVILNSCVWRQHFAISIVDVQIYFVHTISISQMLSRFNTFLLPYLDYWHTVGVTCQPGTRIPPRSISSHPWYIQGFMFVMHIFVLGFILDCEIDYDSLFSPFHCKTADECIHCTSTILYQKICNVSFQK